MNKKFLIIGSAALVLILIFVIVIFMQQSTVQKQALPKPTTLNRQNPAGIRHSNQTSTVPYITFAPPSDTPQAAVKQFYDYYFASPTNPLANGAYKKNPYLSSDFKQVIGSLYNNGNVPVFCPQNKRKNIIVGQETPVNYTNAILMQEFISEAPPGNKDLYRVQVQEVNNTWLIYDINCIY
ncbi:MAG TPA: hypothetical protein VND99_02800 [Candidatus Acidoferrales bacterium]|nr:hypothetical protein [Candidatus Acidoferrales bacterium]